MFLMDKLSIMFRAVLILAVIPLALALWGVVYFIEFITRSDCYHLWVKLESLADWLNETTDELSSDVYVLTGVDLRDKD